MMNSQALQPQGHVAKVTSSEQVKAVIAILMENGKIARATHNIMAYRITLTSGAHLQVCLPSEPLLHHS